MKRDTKVKIITFIAVLIVNIICTACVYLFSIETTTLKIVGSFASIIIVSAVVWFFPTRFFITTLIFVFFASSLGSCVNLYRHVEFYDLFVHFLSGVLIFEGGRIIIEFVNKRRDRVDDSIINGLFSLFFSCSCAAFWEIYEYLCDVLINADMQGSKGNTMGDIIAGVLGAASGFIFYFLTYSKVKNRGE